MMLAVALLMAVATSKPDDRPEKPSRPAPAERVAPAAPPQRVAPPPPAPTRALPPVRAVVQPGSPVRVVPQPITRVTLPPANRISPPHDPRRPISSPTPNIATTQAPLVTTVYVNNDDDRGRYRRDFYSPYDYNPYYTANYYPVYYPVFIFMPLVPGFCNSYNSCYESFGTPGTTGYTSSEVQGFILGQQGNTIVVFTPNQQMLFVNASYLLQSGYPRYRFAPGTFVDIAGYYYQNQFVAIGMF